MHAQLKGVDDGQKPSKTEFVRCSKQLMLGLKLDYIMSLAQKFIVLLIMTCLPLAAWSQSVTKEQIKGLDEQVQDIKKDVLSISAELSLLEEKLLFPSNTQVSVFVSVVADSQYQPDAVQMKINGKDVAHHIYTYNEVDAMAKGGVQRIYTGNLSSGDHALEISVIGKTKGSNSQTEKANFTISKDVGPKLVELRLGSSGNLIALKEQ